MKKITTKVGSDVWVTYIVPDTRGIFGAGKWCRGQAEKWYRGQWGIVHIPTGCTLGYSHPTRKAAITLATELFGRIQRKRLLASDDPKQAGRAFTPAVKRFLRAAQ